MNFNTISALVIYAAMFGFLYSCINPGGLGLIRLYRLSQDLHSAAKQLKDRAFCSDLERQIRGGTTTAVDTLFSTKVLSAQMQQYSDSIYYMELHPGDKCRTDIDEYINYDLLHQQGRIDMCEHTTSGFTALGLLGTFLGVAFGLNSLSQNDSQQIIIGINGLLDGMGLAFLTSIIGIVLSLFLGTALRLVLAAAESNLDLFLTLFRNNVMRNQSEAALNEIIQHISAIESNLNTSNEIQVNALDRTVSAFIAKLNNDMGLQIGFLQSAIQDMSREQRTHSISIQNLTTQMNTMSKSLQNAGNSFLPILAQSSALSEQFDLANQALTSSIKEIRNLLTDDAAALSRHQQLQAELMRTSEAMQKTAASIQTQSDELTKHHQKAFNNSLTHFAQVSKDVSDGLTSHSVQNMTALQNHARELMDSIPQRGVSTGQLNRLLEQNQMLIDQQAKVIRLMEDQSRRTLISWARRTKK